MPDRLWTIGYILNEQFRSQNAEFWRWRGVSARRPEGV